MSNSEDDNKNESNNAGTTPAQSTENQASTGNAPEMVTVTVKGVLQAERQIPKGSPLSAALSGFSNLENYAFRDESNRAVSQERNVSNNITINSIVKEDKTVTSTARSSGG